MADDDKKAAPKDDDKPADSQEATEQKVDEELKPDDNSSDQERPDPEASEEDMATDEEKAAANAPDEPAEEEAPADESDKPGDEATSDEPEAEPTEEPNEPEAADEPTSEESEPVAEDESTAETEADADADEAEATDTVEEEALPEGVTDPKDLPDAPDVTTIEKPSAAESEDYKTMQFDAPDPDAPNPNDLVAAQKLKAEQDKAAAEADAADVEVDKKTLAGMPSIATGEIVVGGHRSRKPLWIALLLLLLLGAATYYWLVYRDQANPAATNNQQTTQTADTETTPLTLDPSKDYGDKYADGVLPVGDGKMVTDAAKTGYIYACDQYAQNQKTANAGAETRGPWFTSNNTEYNLNKKLAVQGGKTWTSSFSNKVDGDTRTITTNDLPSHSTGTFPVSSSDPAYQYDRNPNTITAQDLSYGLPASPTYNATPTCMGGESGIMLTGVVLLNGFDAGARDAGAWEVQDGCQGHPQESGIYHYHTLSSCITNANVDTVIGYALDGFPITGPTVSKGNVLTTSDLDECHGITSTLKIDGKTVTTYHYVMTQDFPYSVSCFRGDPMDSPGIQGNHNTTSAPTGNQTTVAPASTTPKPDPTLPPPRQ